MCKNIDILWLETTRITKNWRTIFVELSIQKLHILPQKVAEPGPEFSLLDPELH
jgi:hypothetical protein